MSPDYFLHQMRWWEVNRYLAGMRRRYRPTWESTRALQWWLTCMFSDRKKSSPPAHPDDLYQFTWEKRQPVGPQITPEEAREMQEMMNNYKW